MKKIVLLLLFVLLSIPGSLISSAQGNRATIQGKVTDAITGEPLIGTNIQIIGTSLGASTDLNGEYIVPGITAGTVDIVFRYIGYQNNDQLGIELSPGQTLELNVTLSPEAIQGQEVVITMQAKGQRAAINQQLASNSISNIISSEKIRDVPDVNAAESIGRLPGVSLRRTGGEGNQIVVRGLSPQYTIVQVDGVRLQGVGLGRDVGLSSISSEMLDGIELSKSLTPDKDADAIGGVVNLRTRVAEKGFHFGVLAQGGYNSLQNSFSNYKYGANVSNRFFDNKLGFIATASTEQVYRSSDQYTAGYGNEIHAVDTNDQGKVIYDHRYYTNNENIQENIKLRHRDNASLVLDYKTDWMELKLNNTYSRMLDENETRHSQFRHSSADYRHLISDSDPLEIMQSHSFSGLFKFLNTELVLDAQYSLTTLDNNTDRYIFEDNYVIDDGQGVIYKDARLYAEPFTLLQLYDISTAEQAYLDPTDRSHIQREDQTARVNLNWKIPFTISDNISGNVKVGGSYSVKDRWADTDAYWSYYHGGIGEERADIVYGFYPEFAHYSDPDYRPGQSMRAINFVDPDYDFGSVLRGVTGIDIGWTADLDFLKEVHDFNGEDNGRYPADHTYVRGVQSSVDDYTNKEEYIAGFFMMELMIGDRIMILPGVRHETMNTSYTANYVVENQFEPTGMQPGYPDTITVDDRSNQYLFPSVNIKVDITPWMDIRGAYYMSTSRPNYSLLSPVMVSDRDKLNITARNPYLKPAIADNYDLGVSFFDNKLGLLTLNVFYKEITDLIYRLPKYDNGYFDIAEGVPESMMESLEAPRDLYRDDLFNAITGTASMNNYPINNPNKANFIGFEASWQTNFWYLPGLLRGLVLDLNYTFIRSKTEYPYLSIYATYTDDFPIPKKITHADYTTREGVMLDQPNSIYNARIGWDYKGFSTRVSFRYQGESLQGLNPQNENQDRYRRGQFRMDMMAKQQIYKGLSVNLDVANLTRVMDEFYMSAEGRNLPQSMEYYGLTSQVSLRYDF